MELSLLTTLSTKIWVDFGKHCERFSSLGHFRMLPTPGHFPTQMFPDFFNRRVMFNGTSVITHVIVSIWHQPTSPMISSVQMYSSFINLGQNEVTITPNQSSRLEFALTCNSFPHSFHSLELTCCVAGFQGFWVGFLALVLRQAWHCRHHDTCQGSLVKSQIWWQKDVCLKNLKHYFAGHFWYCSQKMWNIRNCSNQNELQDTAWTGAPRSNPSHFKRSNYFFLVSGFQFFFFRSDIKTFLLLSWVGHPQQVLLLSTGGSEPPLPCCHWPFDGLHGPEQESDGCNNPGCWFMTFWISIMVFQSYEMGRKRTCHTNFPVVKSQGFLFIKAILN